jgi:Zinc finger, C2H2 type/C2H2-type zinc finger
LKIVTKEEEEIAKAQLKSLGGKLSKTYKKKVEKVKVKGTRGRQKAKLKISAKKTSITARKLKKQLTTEPVLEEISKAPQSQPKIKEIFNFAMNSEENSKLSIASPPLPTKQSHPTAFTSVFIKETPTKDNYICQVCGFQTSLQASLQLHIQSHQLKKFQICSLKFNNKPDLNRHLRSVLDIPKPQTENVKEFICDICGANITTFTNMTRHMQQHQPKEKCSVCNAKLRNLSKHMKEVHTTNRPFLCTICGSGFKAKHNLSSHLKTHDKPSECPICHKFLPNMQRHIQWHKRPKPALFQCPECLKSCATKQSMQEHIGRVHEKLPLGRCYKCTICDLNFIRNNDLRRHSYIHYSGKIFTCKHPGCIEMFKTSSKLNQHKMVHNASNEASFFCNYCDKKYLRKTALHKHMRAAHPEVKITGTVSNKSIDK